MRVRLLGVFEFEGLQEPSAAVLRTLLGALAFNAGSAVSQELLIQYVWDDTPPATARGTLQSRKANLVRDGFPISADRDGYLLDIPRHEVDVTAFMDASDEMQRRSDRLSSDGIYVEADHVLKLWRGAPTVPTKFSDGQLGSQHVTALLAKYAYLQRLRVRSLIEMSKFEEANLLAEPLVKQDPSNEGLTALLVRGLYGANRQTEALAAYSACERALDQIGVLPGDDLMRLRDQVHARHSTAILLPTRYGNRGTVPRSPGQVRLILRGASWSSQSVKMLGDQLVGKTSQFGSLEHAEASRLDGLLPERPSDDDCLLVLGDKATPWTVLEEICDVRAQGHRVALISLDESGASESPRILGALPALIWPSNSRASDLEPLLTELLSVARPADLQVRQRGIVAAFWPYRTNDCVYLVCAELPVELRLPYAEARTPDHLRLAKFADIDALFLANTGLSRLARDVSVRPTITAEMGPTDLSEHLVLIGGPAWNSLTSQYCHGLGLPIEHEDGGPGNPDPYRLSGTEQTWTPEFSPSGDVTADVGLVVRAPNLAGDSRTVFIFSGVLTHGVEGSVKSLLDPICAEENIEWLNSKFGSAKYFAVLMRISVVNNYNVPPKFAAPSTVLAAAAWNEGEKRFVLVD